MRVVGIGGGTGLPVLLRGLKELKSSGVSIDITAIVTVADSGGSTGILREAFKMPAMGDIRKCMVALAAQESVLASVCQYRFDTPETLAGHPLGNLILSALYEISGSFGAAVRQACELLRLSGLVLPVTENPVALCASYEDGGTVRGEVNIPQRGRCVHRVWLEHQCHAAAGPGVIEALAAADVIAIGPGSLYTSIIPNLLVDGISEAIRESKAVRVYVCNLMTQPGETEGYSAADHVRALLQYVSPIDACVLNARGARESLGVRYRKSGAQMVATTAQQEEEMRRIGVMPIVGPLLNDGEMKARHDPMTLAELVVSAVQEYAVVP